MKAGLAVALLLVSTQGHTAPALESAFSGWSGNWSGGGTITMTNGSTQQIRCQAAYIVNDGGRAAQQTLRCASDSYKVDINSQVISEGRSLSGSWAETTRGLSGNISGYVKGSHVAANVTGADFAARLNLQTQGERQLVTIRPLTGTDVVAVTVSLHKS